MKKHEDFLENALVAAGVKKLPKEIKSDAPYDGMAIIKIRKIGGKEYFGLGTWNSDAKRSNIAMDFDKKSEDRVVETYPIGKVAKTESPKEMEKRIEAEVKAKIKLKELDIEFNDGAKLPELTELLKSHQAELDKIQAEKDEKELDELKDWHLKRGYAETHVKKLNLDAAQSSKDTLSGIEAEIIKLGGTPVNGKKAELDAQLKDLKR